MLGLFLLSAMQLRLGARLHIDYFNKGWVSYLECRLSCVKAQYPSLG